MIRVTKTEIEVIDLLEVLKSMIMIAILITITNLTHPLFGTTSMRIMTNPVRVQGDIGTSTVLLFMTSPQDLEREDWQEENGKSMSVRVTRLTSTIESMEYLNGISLRKSLNWREQSP